MTATVTDVAQAVVDELNAATFSQPFVAERVAIFRHDLEALATMRVFVIPRSTETEQVARASRAKVVEIDCGFKLKLDAVDNETVDPLVALIDEVVDHFLWTRLPTLQAAMCTASRADPVYDMPTLGDQQRVFFGVVRLTFRVNPP